MYDNNILLTDKKIENGLMIMKNGKAWGIKYGDAQFTEYGWLDPVDERVEIHNPEFCHSTSDVTYTGSPHIKELSTGKLVHVERVTTIEVRVK